MEKEKEVVKEVAAEAASGVTLAELKELAEEIKALHAESLEARAKKFNLSPEEDAIATKSEEKRSETVKFLSALADGNKKALRAMDSARAKTLNETTGSAGGYLVPEEFEKNVLRYMEQYSQIRQNASVISMGSDVKRLNSLTGEPTVYIVDELDTITGSGLTFGEPVLTAKKYAAIVDWSNEVAEDSEAPLVNLVAERIGRAVAKREQTEFITSATAGSQGLLTVSGVTGLELISGTTFSNITWEDLAAMDAALGEVDEMDAMEAKYYMSRSVYNVLRTKKAVDSGVFFLPVAPSMDQKPMAWGKEIVIVNQMPLLSATATATKFVVYSNLKLHGWIGDRSGLRVKLLDQGSVGSVNLATQDAEALRVVKRTAWTTALQNGIVTLATN